MGTPMSLHDPDWTAEAIRLHNKIVATLDTTDLARVAEFLRKTWDNGRASVTAQRPDEIREIKVPVGQAWETG